MNGAFDVNDLIAEQASDTSERLALDAVARRLESGLESPVPSRPEFREELRQALIAAARQRMRPWYRRPAFIGSGISVAAAAAVLVIGLNLWQQAPAPTPAPEQTAQTEPAAPQPAENEPALTQPPTSFLVALPSDLKEVTLADEPAGTLLSAGAVGTVGDPVSAAGGLQLKRLTAQPSEADLRAMAVRLAFRGESRRTDTGWAVTDEQRSLTLAADGEVQYADRSEGSPAAAPVDVEAATQAARRFLDQALLPVHSQPAVTQQDNGYVVVYTEHVDGRPVVNARTEIEVSPEGSVTRAKAYVASGVTTHATYTAVLSEADALQQAASRGGAFERADLVWVRTAGEGTVYLQPYWRALGTDSQGEGVVRYVPALRR